MFPTKCKCMSSSGISSFDIYLEKHCLISNTLWYLAFMSLENQVKMMGYFEVQDLRYFQFVMNLRFRDTENIHAVWPNYISIETSAS